MLIFSPFVRHAGRASVSPPTRRRWRSVGMLLCLGLFAAMANGNASGVELRTDAPLRYTVRQGDTLWDIAGRFLHQPWRWPEVWQANPEVANPHRIFPGDTLVLIQRDGQARVTLETSDMPVTRLSPRVRVTPLERAIPTVPVGAISPFLTRPMIAEATRIDAAPYVVGFPDERAVAGRGDRLFVRRLDTAPGTRYELVRPGVTYRDFDTGEPLGLEATFLAAARLDRPGDPAVLTILRSAREVGIGDRVLPAVDDEPLTDFLPRPAPPTLRGHIVGVLNGVTQIGQYDVVALDRGTEDGVAAGFVFEIFRGGEARVDTARATASQWNWREETPLNSTFWFGDWRPFAWGRGEHTGGEADLPLHVRSRRQGDRYLVPDSSTGLLMVFRAFPRVSFALVMRATSAIQVGAVVAAPRQD